jgi:predicted DNA-binding mobile mystery protein A
MTTRQMAKRMDFTQSRVSKMERAEAHGQITLNSLDRAAEALGCQVVYLVLPKRPLTETLEQQAHSVAEKQIRAVEHTMRLEAQEVHNRKVHNDLVQQAAEKLLKRPSRLWDDA